jgi:hypothetical protein
MSGRLRVKRTLRLDALGVLLIQGSVSSFCLGA